MSGRNRHHWSGFLSGNEPEKDEFIEKLESILSFRVSEDTHYRRALRHRSLVDGEDMHLSETYERLEFLGDAVLDLIATEIIFKSFPQKDEGFLTKLRARMVRGDTLAELAYGLGLNTVLEVGGHVRDKGIELSKSVLADIFESLVAAIYLSEGYKIAYSFVEKIYSDQIDLEMLSGTTDNYK
ncbi:MAG: ribonuclease III domain-containing protein, partial [Balneolaceae bacterium]